VNILIFFFIPFICPRYERVVEANLGPTGRTADVAVPWRPLRCPLPPLHVQSVPQGASALPLSGDVGAVLGTPFMEFHGRQC